MTVTGKMRKLIKTIFRRFGYRIVADRNLGPSFQFLDDPLDVIYSGLHIDRAAVCVDLWKCSNYTGLTYGEEGWHPFASSLMQYRTKRVDYESSILKKYYETWTPANAVDAFITFDSPPAVFRDEPSFAFVSPWHTINVEQRKKKISDNVRDENRDEGFGKIGIEKGFSLHGPVSNLKGRIEFDRLLKTFRSIDKHGFRYQRFQNLIDGFALVDGDGEEFRIVVVHGNHRLAALTALGYEKAPIRLVPPYVVRAADVNRWPQVKSKLWSTEEALNYFESFFSAHSKIRNWAEARNLRRS